MKKLLFALAFILFTCPSYAEIKTMYEVANVSDLDNNSLIGQMSYVNDTDTAYIKKRAGFEVLGAKSMANHLAQYNHSQIGQGASIPSGMIMMMLSGSCPAGWTEVQDMVGYTIVGTNATNADANTTGGNDSITPSGSVSAPIWTGDAKTPAGNVSSLGLTLNSITPTGNSTKALTMNALSTAKMQANATGTSVDTTTTPLGNLTSTTLTINAFTPTGNLTSGALTMNSVTPTGNNTAPTFTGASFDNRQLFRKCIFCRKD